MLRTGAHGLTIYPIARIGEAGIDWGTWPGPDDEVGYAMQPYRGDDCLQAAVATCTQVPIEQVPDLGLSEGYARGGDADEISALGWARIESWATKRGLRLVLSEAVPLSRGRWIGVVGRPELARFADRSQDNGATIDVAHPFQDHCLVMRGTEVWFDPAIGMRLPAGAIGHVVFGIDDITYGLAFERKEET